VILFWACAVVLVASAVFTITQKAAVYSVVGLLANFLALAVLYVSLDAEFLGIIQIVVYTGAILMLFVFVIALLSSGIGPIPEGVDRLPRAPVPATLLVLATFVLLVFGLGRAPIAVTPHVATSVIAPAGSANTFGSVADFGVALFTTHLLPFELTAFVLMVAVIGVVLLASDAVPMRTTGTHKRRPRIREPIAKAPSREGAKR